MIILVTGGNRGIGYAIVKSISIRYPKSTILLGCRNTNFGEEAAEQLQKDGAVAAVEAIQIDIESDSSIIAAVKSIEQKFGRLDVLINNAIKLERPSSQELTCVRSAANTCYNNAITSNIIVTKAMEPLLRKVTNPRVIMVSSTRGSMGRTAKERVSPGHCKTGFNGFRGTKDPADGAEVVLRLLDSAEGEIGGGTFWEYENGVFQMPPW